MNISQLKEDLLNAFCEREDAQTKVTNANDRIKAIHNVIAGINLAGEVQKANAAAAKVAENNGAPQP